MGNITDRLKVLKKNEKVYKKVVDTKKWFNVVTQPHERKSPRGEGVHSR